VTVKGAAVAVKLNADEVLATKFVSPAYTAVTLCVPAGSVVRVRVATPDEFRVPVPSVVKPSLKETDSPLVVRVSAANGLKVAVSTTDCP
jgi:hypothetical protein